MPPRLTIVDGKKSCSLCKEWLPVVELAPSKQSATGLSSWCRTCTKQKAAITRAARQTDPAKLEADRASKRKYKAGLTAEVKKLRNREEVLRRSGTGVTTEWYEALFAE